MVTEFVQITQLCNRIRRRFGNLVLTLRQRCGFQEPEVRHVDIEDALQLGVQKIRIPGTQLRSLIVRQRVGPALLVRQVVEANAGHLVHAQLLGRLQAPVALHDQVLAPNANRVREAELADAGHDGLNVLVRMLPGIFLVRLQRRNRQILDMQLHKNLRA